MGFLNLTGNSFKCSASRECLVSATRDGDLQEAKALFDYNPRLARYSTFGVRNSPLHYSAAQGHHEIVMMLLESGIDIDLRNYRGQTALMQACQYGHWEVVQILVLFKANILRVDYLNGGTALHLAALNGYYRCISVTDISNHHEQYESTIEVNEHSMNKQKCRLMAFKFKAELPCGTNKKFRIRCEDINHFSMASKHCTFVMMKMKMKWKHIDLIIYIWYVFSTTFVTFTSENNILCKFRNLFVR